MKIEINSEQQVIVINGIALSFELMNALTMPDGSKWFRAVRRGNSVKVSHCSSMTEIDTKGMVIN